MKKKRVVSLFIVILLVMCAFIFIGATEAIFTPQSAPKVKPDAPTEVKLLEDQLPVYIDLYDIYEDSVSPFTFNVWDGSTWSKSFQNDNITISIKPNATLEFAPKPDMFGTDKIIINATNSSSMLSTHHNLTVTIAPTNDPPVIEMIGNVKVTDTEYINLFLYQNIWFNETVIASDIDGDTLVFLDNTSAFDINYLTGNISFLPTNDDIGDIYVNITVSDVNDTNFEDWIIVQFTILNVNDPPIAQINYPLNGSYIYQDEYIQFEGEGFDPDIPYGDVLEFEWTSDLDGLLGVGEVIYIYYLSAGLHQITLNVTDSEGLFDEDVISIIVEKNPYDKYSELWVSLNNNTLILKQNDTGIRKVSIINRGKAEENVVFELKTYFEFEGKVEFEMDNITVESFDSTSVNVTVTVPSDAQIGFYPIEIYARSVDDDYYDYWREDQAIATLKVIVISNQTEDTTKQATKPNWFLKDVWEYSINFNDAPLDMSGTVTMEITKDTKTIVNDNTYDVFVMEMETDLEITIDDDPFYDDFYNEIEVNMSGVEYYRKSDLATVKSGLVSEMEMDFLGETMTFETESNTTYDPPVPDLDFPLKPGKIWIVTTEVTTVTKTRYTDYLGGNVEEDQDFDFTKKTMSYICLGTESVTTPAGTFEAYLIMEFINEYDEIYENNNDPEPRPKEPNGKRQDIVEPEEGDVTITYYAPDVNFTLKQVSYHQIEEYDYDNWTELYDWEQNALMELTSYSLDNDDGGTEPKPPEDEPDRDDDGLPDDWEDEYDVDDPDEDSDNDGFTNLNEYLKGTDPTDSEDTPENPIDLDEDGLPDSWEYYYDLDPSDPGDADEDTDNDGFSNREELNAHTSPTNPDDHPPISSKKKDRDEGVFGLGKLGALDMFYIYLAIIIVIIILLAMTFVIRHRRRRRAYYRQPGYEQRVSRTAPAPATETAASAGASQPPVAKPAQPQPPTQRYPEPPPPPPPPDEHYQYPRASYNPTPQQYSPQYTRQYPPRNRTPPPRQYY